MHVIPDLCTSHEINELNCAVDGLKETSMNDAELLTHTGLRDEVI